MVDPVHADIDRRIEVIDGPKDSLVWHVSDLRALPFVVLLGEPGIGKSTVLEDEAAHEGLHTIKVRELMTGPRVGQDETLYLDALDEYRTDGGAADKVHTLAHAMTAANPTRWRLTCRSEDWRKDSDISAIRKTTSGAPIVVAQLLPLDNDEAAAILAALGETDPGAFLTKARTLGASGFVENPLSLKLLQKAVSGGGKWPDTRYELFGTAIGGLAFERDKDRSQTERTHASDIVNAAGTSCLLLLASGARAIWRSNDEPLGGGDTRAYVTARDLKLSRPVLDDMLDTALFRGEGETFEPMHRTVAEFLAGKALAEAVVGANGRTLPLSRATALITGSDGQPPTELRGLYAWVAVHLTKLGDSASAMRLIEADPVTVLAYGDAAAFDTSARRAILQNLGRSDPYFRASEVGITAVGGLAGEDLAADFRALLTDRSDRTHRLLTVFEALTIGRPVASLRPVLRSFALDASRPEHQRIRAVDAFLNGATEPERDQRELFDELSAETGSVTREALRAQLAAKMRGATLTADDVKSVLSSYRQAAPDNMMGRLYTLQRRLESDPIPELFDEPIATWLPANTGRGGGIEVNQLLDYAMASAIRSTPNLSAARLWRWIANVRREQWSELKDQTKRALAEWVDADVGRELELFDLILKDYQPTTAPRMVQYTYNRSVGRSITPAIIKHLLAKLPVTSSRVDRRRLLVSAVDLARSQQNADLYWETYDLVEREPACKALLKELTVTKIDKWRRQNQKFEAAARRRKDQERAKNNQTIAPSLTTMRSGGRPDFLYWAAQFYFSGQADGDHAVGVQRVAHYTNAEATEAIVAGWKYLATKGLGTIDAQQLGKSEADGRPFFAVGSAIAGLDLLLTEGDLPGLATVPIEVALAAFTSSFFVVDQDRRGKLEKWALDQLNVVPAVGAKVLVEFWGAALDAGAKDLQGVWRLREGDARTEVARRTVADLLTMRPAMPPIALKSTLKAAAKCLDRDRLLSIAETALADTKVTGSQREIWAFVAFTLGSTSPAGQFVVDPGEDAAADVLIEDSSDGLVEALSGVEGVDRIKIDAMAVRQLGKVAVPEDWPGVGIATRRQSLSEIVNRAISNLAGAPQAEAGGILAECVQDPKLVKWRSTLQHAQAQHSRLIRDNAFAHPSPSVVGAALTGGAPVNASDLRAIVLQELRQLASELRVTDTTPWKRYWNIDPKTGQVTAPLVENHCRDHLLDRLRDRLGKYGIAAALPETRRGDETRADMVILSGAGRNLPVEAKRHFHDDIWVAASTQLQGYSADPGADGFGIYLVFWFGNDASPTPSRPDGAAGPGSAIEMEAMLVKDLPAELKKTTDVVVFDVSNSQASGLRKPRQKRSKK
jgi:hypothetical protein